MHLTSHNKLKNDLPLHDFVQNDFSFLLHE